MQKQNTINLYGLNSSRLGFLPAWVLFSLILGIFSLTGLQVYNFLNNFEIQRQSVVALAQSSSSGSLQISNSVTSVEFEELIPTEISAKSFKPIELTLRNQTVCKLLPIDSASLINSEIYKPVSTWQFSNCDFEKTYLQIFSSPIKDLNQVKTELNQANEILPIQEELGFFAYLLSSNPISGGQMARLDLKGQLNLIGQINEKLPQIDSATTSDSYFTLDKVFHLSSGCSQISSPENCFFWYEDNFKEQVKLLKIDLNQKIVEHSGITNLQGLRFAASQDFLPQNIQLIGITDDSKEILLTVFDLNYLEILSIVRINQSEQPEVFQKYSR